MRPRGCTAHSNAYRESDDEEQESDEAGLVVPDAELGGTVVDVDQGPQSRVGRVQHLVHQHAEARPQQSAALLGSHGNLHATSHGMHHRSSHARIALPRTTELTISILASCATQSRGSKSTLSSTSCSVLFSSTPTRSWLRNCRHDKARP